MSTRLRWLGHSALWIETNDGHKLLIDPFLTDNPVAAARPDDLDPDFILISHGHGDHVGDALAIAQRTGATIIANFEIATWFSETHNYPKTHGLQHGGGHAFDFGRCELTLAFHGSVLPDGSNGGNPAGFYLTLNDGTTIYDAADTGLFGDMRLIGEMGVDLALLPIGDNFTMGPAAALKAVQLIGPKRVVPIHYNTFPLIAQDPHAWAQSVSAETRTEPTVLDPGGWLELTS